MNSLLLLIDSILGIYSWIIIISVISSWLITFNLINVSHPIINRILYALNRLTEPVYGYIRRILPNLGGIDISPLLLLLAIYFIRNLLREYSY